MATIRDVANYAGVSVGTVSHVLNGHAAVRFETRERVMAAIKALNYHPSAVARSLTTRRTNTIGMVRTELRPDHANNEPDPFILDLIDGITGAAAEEGTGLCFWTIPVGAREMALYQRLVHGRQVDGLIIFALRQDDPRIAFLKGTDFPFVVFGHDGLNDEINWIDVDGNYGIQLAVNHLAELGHRRVGYLAPPSEQYLAQQRWSGFVEAMRAHQLDIDMKLVYEGDYTEHAGQRGAEYLLRQHPRPTAMICNNDRMAFGAMRAIQARGLAVGEDISIVGFDDITLARYWQPALTTVHQPIREIGETLFTLLQAVIDGDGRSVVSGRLIKPELRVRQSTGVP